MRRILTFIFSMAALILLSPSAQANNFDFSGTFATDNEVELLKFTVAATSNITIFSSSWGDDVGSAGYVPGGGFDPRLRIWNSDGQLVAKQNDGAIVGTTYSNGRPYDYGVYDIFLRLSLSPGVYTASIIQSNNEAVSSNLSDGFRYDGNPDYTRDLGFGIAPYFNGAYNLYELGSRAPDPRTGDWEFHILNVERAVQVSSVPDASIMFLLGPGLVGLGLFGRRKLNNK